MFTFQIFNSITIPNKLSTEIDEMFHQRLQKESRETGSEGKTSTNDKNIAA
jgi:hypothetical protein